MKYHKSSTAGVIHIIHSSDYLGVLRTLITPAEVADYLLFREKLIETWGQAVSAVPEMALVGRYLRNLPVEPPSRTFGNCISSLNQQIDEWDISKIIHLFAERRTTPQNSATDYYRILTELAKLNRTDMRQFKERFARSWTR